MSVHRLRETFVHVFILICFPCACCFYLTLLHVVSFNFLFLFLKLRGGVGFSIPIPAPSSLGGGHAYDTSANTPGLCFSLLIPLESTKLTILIVH